MHIIKPVILAAGYGTRLREVVPDLPKPLADVNGRPFITYLFDQLIDVGFKSVIVCISYMADTFYEILGTRYKTLNIIYSLENEPISREQTKMSVHRLLSGSVLFMNGDTYVYIDLKRYLEEAMNSDGILSIVKNRKGTFAGIELVKVMNPKLHCYAAEFIDIGTPETYKLAKEKLK